MQRYAIVVEKAKSNYAAYVPDLPGCVATGKTVKTATGSKTGKSQRAGNLLVVVCMRRRGELPAAQGPLA